MNAVKVNQWTPVTTLLVLAVCVLSYTLLSLQTEDERRLKVMEEALRWTVVVKAYSKNSPEVREGTGFVVDPDGHVVTVRHVAVWKPDFPKIRTLREKYRYTVTLLGHEYEASLVHVNQWPGVDVSILAMEPSRAWPLANIPFARLGNSDRLKVSQSVCAAGVPLSKVSVSCGVISHLAQEVRGVAIPLLQTDAAINQGNSGGPLINPKTGEVIAMGIALIQDRENLGLCIDINRIKGILQKTIWKDPFETPVSLL